MWELVIYELPASWGELIPVMFVAKFDDFITCIAMNTQLTTAMRSLEFASNYILLCSNG
jgi:hypothetical protein